jgi:outer membrane protein TolC
MKKRLALFLVPLFAHALHAQGADTLKLPDLQNAALQNDPRDRTIHLLQQQSNLRLGNIRAERLPSIAVNGQAQYQSTTFTLPITLPGVNFPTPKRDTYDAHVDAREPLFDATRGARIDLERAQLAESQARVSTSLYTLRQSVNDAYFNALLLQERADIERTNITDLEAQLKVAQARVREGTALRSEAATLAAALIARRQSLDEIQSNRRAAINVLADLTGRSIGDSVRLAIPASATATSRVNADSLDARPEVVQFQKARAALEAQRAVVAKKDLPRVSAFGRAGYGRPGLNPLSRQFESYWIAGLQLDWAPLSWGSNSRDRQALAIQGEIVANDEAAFRQGIVRGLETDLASIDRLSHVIASDDSIIALRETILQETRARYRESVITSAEYVDRQTDLLAAQIARATHRVQLAEAYARLETTTGTGPR